jgi:hypothetical protein
MIKIRMKVSEEWKLRESRNKDQTIELPEGEIGKAGK